MDTVKLLASIYVIFVAATGFLFGQVFAGHFSVAATLAGVAGLWAGVRGLGAKANGAKASPPTLWICLAAVAGVAMDAVEYYTKLNIPGNYYAWFMIGPFCGCLILIAFLVRTRND